MIQSRLAAQPRTEVALCSVVRAELIFGAIRTKRSGKKLDVLRRFLGEFVSFPFEDQCAEVCGRIRATLADSGLMIGANDLLIASIALANGLILVTHNVREFSRVPDLRWEDWQGGSTDD